MIAFRFALYQLVTTAFCVIVLMANIVSVKMVRVPFLLDLSIPAGVLFYPLSFLLSDLVTEMYGPVKAKQMVYIALVMNLMSLCLLHFTLILPAVSSEEQEIYRLVLGLSGWRIFSSLTAYIVGQIVGIQVYTLIKSWTGSRYMWLRTNGSAWASQIVDTIVVDMIALYWGLNMGWGEIFPIIAFSYAYKVFFSLVATPLFYVCVELAKTKRHAPQHKIMYGLNRT